MVKDSSVYMLVFYIIMNNLFETKSTETTINVDDLIPSENNRK